MDPVTVQDKFGVYLRVSRLPAQCAFCCRLLKPAKGNVLYPHSGTFVSSVLWDSVLRLLCLSNVTKISTKEKMK